MSHTIKARNLAFIHNSDFSGDGELVVGYLRLTVTALDVLKLATLLEGIEVLCLDRDSHMNYGMTCLQALRSQPANWCSRCAERKSAQRL